LTAPRRLPKLIRRCPSRIAVVRVTRREHAGDAFERRLVAPSESWLRGCRGVDGPWNEEGAGATRRGDGERCRSLHDTAGDWYANVLFFKPLLALFVNEATLLPVLVPFAPAATLLDRFPPALLAHLQAHGVPRSFSEPELAEMAPCRLVKPASRNVLGVMNEFRFLADTHVKRDDETDPMSLSLRLAMTPCAPLYKRHGSPDRELAALASSASET